MARTAQEINPKSADRLKQLCNDMDISQTKLAELSGVTANTISKITTRKSPLTHRVATQIVEAFPAYRAEWLEGLDDDPIVTGGTFVRSAAKAAKRFMVFHNCFIQIAMLCGYSISSVKTDVQALNYIVKDATTGYRISKGRRIIYLSDDEMAAFENEMSDYVDFKFRHLFKQKEAKNG